MKTSLFRNVRLLGVATFATMGLMALSPEAYAKDKDKPSPGKGRPIFSFRGHDDRRHDDRRRDDDDRRRFFAYPRSNFTVTLGNGYAGRGYYYGPPNVPYYYQGSGISYYSSRDRVPHHYWGRSSLPVEFAVQRALAERGYYRGPIDGVIGAMGQRAIRDFQRDRRLPVTGNINKETLRALGLM